MPPELPEITAAIRLDLRPGDSLVIRLNADVITDETADEVRHRVRHLLRRPELPVLVLARRTFIEVISGGTG